VAIQTSRWIARERRITNSCPRDAVRAFRRICRRRDEKPRWHSWTTVTDVLRSGRGWARSALNPEPMSKAKSIRTVARIALRAAGRRRGADDRKAAPGTSGNRIPRRPARRKARQRRIVQALGDVLAVKALTSLGGHIRVRHGRVEEALAGDGTLRFTNRRLGFAEAAPHQHHRRQREQVPRRIATPE